MQRATDQGNAMNEQARAIPADHESQWRVRLENEQAGYVKLTRVGASEFELRPMVKATFNVPDSTSELVNGP